MAGGRGERFWPVSTPSHPKHLAKIFDGGKKSLMQLALKRVASAVDDVRIITSRPQEALMRKMLKQLSANGKILAEPVGRDTCAAVALASRWAQKDFSDDTLIAMLPADHYINDVKAFKRTLRKAFEVAEETDSLVTIGIPPTRPATGYGYLQKGEAHGVAFRVKSFKEKPSAAVAQEYVNSGKYLWNSGIFVWKVSAIIRALEAYAPNIWNAVKNLNPANAAELERVYPNIEKISIDYAVMEKADNVYTVPAAFDWDDMGEWAAWARLQTADVAGNTAAGHIFLHEAKENVIFNDDPKHLLAVVGVEGLTVVHTRQATLVTTHAKAAELKALVKKIGETVALKRFVE